MSSASDLPLWTAFVAALVPAAAVVVATIAAFIAWRSHARQKRADRHQEMWTSLTWALEQLADPENAYKVQLGMSVLTSLGKDTIINKADNRLLGKINLIVMTHRFGATDDDDMLDPYSRQLLEDAPLLENLMQLPSGATSLSPEETEVVSRTVARWVHQLKLRSSTPDRSSPPEDDEMPPSTATQGE